MFESELEGLKISQNVLPATSNFRQQLCKNISILQSGLIYSSNSKINLAWDEIFVVQLNDSCKTKMGKSIENYWISSINTCQSYSLMSCCVVSQSNYKITVNWLSLKLYRFFVYNIWNHFDRIINGKHNPNSKTFQKIQKNLKILITISIISKYY